MHGGNKTTPKETVKEGLGERIQRSAKGGEQKEPGEGKSSRPNDDPKIMRPKFKRSNLNQIRQGRPSQQGAGMLHREPVSSRQQAAGWG